MKIRKLRKIKQKQIKYNLFKNQIRKGLEEIFKDVSFNIENYLNKIIKKYNKILESLL